MASYFDEHDCEPGAPTGDPLPPRRALLELARSGLSSTAWRSTWTPCRAATGTTGSLRPPPGAPWRGCPRCESTPRKQVGLPGALWGGEGPPGLPESRGGAPRGRRRRVALRAGPAPGLPRRVRGGGRRCGRFDAVLFLGAALLALSEGAPVPGVPAGIRSGGDGKEDALPAPLPRRLPPALARKDQLLPALPPRAAHR